MDERKGKIIDMIVSWKCKRRTWSKRLYVKSTDLAIDWHYEHFTVTVDCLGCGGKHELELNW